MARIKYLILILVLLVGFGVKAQTQANIDKEICEELLMLNFDYFESKTSTKLEPLKRIIENAGSNFQEDSLQISHLMRSNQNKERDVIADLTAAYYYQNYYPRGPKTLASIRQALETAESSGNPCYLKLAIIVFLEIHARKSTISFNTLDFYIDKYNQLSGDDIEKAWPLYYKNLFESNSSLSRLDIYVSTAKEIISYLEKFENDLNENMLAKFYEVLGVYYRFNKEPQLAKDYMMRNIALKNTPSNQRHKFISHLDYGRILIEQNNPTEAKKAFDAAKNCIIQKDSLESLATYYRFKAIYYDEPLGHFEDGYWNVDKANRLKLKLNTEVNNLALTQLEVELRTAEKDKRIAEQEKDFLLEQKQKTQNRNIAIGLGGTLALGSVIGLLAYRNTKRKQRIAEQQREIEIQKTEKILKEQELTTIDAMIAGQEKERQRLAIDLHDSVGATLSAARLQFEHIAANKDQLDSLDELLQKTGVLLDEAYNEVRSMAHAKNSGVIAKNGLLPAVERLAKNVSGTNTLKVEVQDFGLENRLDNSLEIAIFRIIQELITNVIKHARATEAHISITQHEDALSIIVEDNGRGFNARKLPKKEGMGLSSIETRVEHMEGTMEVDSTPGQGTSVLIDIPL